MIEPTNLEIQLTGPVQSTVQIDEDDLAKSIDAKEAMRLVAAIYDHHGVKAFEDVSAEVIAEYHVAEDT